MPYIPCQNCGKEYPHSWNWMICNQCGFRVCMSCLNTHKGKYGSGFKCSKCIMGQMKRM